MAAKSKSNAPDGKGDCYAAAARFATEVSLGLHPFSADDIRVCHGEAEGTGGDALGLRYGHAWVEVHGQIVIDRSNGNDIIVRADYYYDIGHVTNVHRYTLEEVKHYTQRTGHYGPWEDDGEQKTS